MRVQQDPAQASFFAKILQEVLRSPSTADDTMRARCSSMKSEGPNNHREVTADDTRLANLPTAVFFGVISLQKHRTGIKNVVSRSTPVFSSRGALTLREPTHSRWRGCGCCCTTAALSPRACVRCSISPQQPAASHNAEIATRSGLGGPSACGRSCSYASCSCDGAGPLLHRRRRRRSSGVFCRATPAPCTPRRWPG